MLSKFCSWDQSGHSPMNIPSDMLIESLRSLVSGDRACIHHLLAYYSCNICAQMVPATPLSVRCAMHELLAISLLIALLARHDVQEQTYIYISLKRLI